LIRASALKDHSQALVLVQAGADGTWGDGPCRRRYLLSGASGPAAGKTLFNANRVVVGHCELMVKWPGRDLNVLHQRVVDFWKSRARRKGYLEMTAIRSQAAVENLGHRPCHSRHAVGTRPSAKKPGKVKSGMQAGLDYITRDKG
jgi:hypothetical protein